MFTNKKTNEAPSGGQTATPQPQAVTPTRSAPQPQGGQQKTGTPSVLSPDLYIKGNLKSVSDIKIEGQVEGDVRARLLTVGEDATIRGQLIADDVVVNGRIMGKIRGIKVRLNSGARVEGDIIHETIAIEAGAHFEGTVKRKDNPLSDDTPTAAASKSKPGSSM